MGFAYLLFSLFCVLGATCLYRLISLFLDDLNYGKILDNSTLPYLFLSARISLIAILVMEIRKSQGGTFVLLGTWNSFSCALF